MQPDLTAVGFRKIYKLQQPAALIALKCVSLTAQGESAGLLPFSAWLPSAG